MKNTKKDTIKDPKMTKIKTEWSFSKTMKEIKNKEVIELVYDNKKSRAVVIQKEDERLHNVNIVDDKLLTRTALENDVIVNIEPLLETVNVLDVFLLSIFLTFLYNIQRVQNNKISNKHTIKTNVKFKDVIGCDESKRELEEIVTLFKNYSKYRERDIKIPKGILLNGPPGTGKTLLAKALSGEADIPFFSMSGSEFVEMFIGLGAKKVRDVFKEAKKKEPSIIFIDEIDTLAKKRNDVSVAGGTDEREQTLNQLLIEMDGFYENNIIVIGTTNRIDVIDPAILRAGRFDRIVNVPLPDVRGRYELFKFYSKNKKIDKNTSLYEFAMLCDGFSGADIKILMNEAGIHAIRNNVDVINYKCLYEAFEKKTFGLSKQHDTRLDEVKYIIAIHEAGHSLIAKHMNEFVTLKLISIKPNLNGSGGYSLYTANDKYKELPTKQYYMAHISILLGGRIAECIYNIKRNKQNDEKVYFDEIYEKSASAGAIQDLYKANEIATYMVESLGFGKKTNKQIAGNNDSYFKQETIEIDIEEILDQCEFTTKNIIEKNYIDLIKLADDLIDNETIYTVQ